MHDYRQDRTCDSAAVVGIILQLPQVLSCAGEVSSAIERTELKKNDLHQGELKLLLTKFVHRTSAVSKAVVHPFRMLLQKSCGHVLLWKAITELLLLASVNMCYPGGESKSTIIREEINRITKCTHSFVSTIHNNNCAGTHLQTFPSFTVYRIPAQSMEPKSKEE